MNEKVLKTLEYYKIIKMLENQAGSEPGKKLCHALVPSADIHKIKENQKQTGDALSRIWQKGSLSFSGIHNIGESIKRLEIGSTLGTGELLRIDSLLKVALRVKTFSRRDDEAERDSLDDMFEAIEPLTNLKNDIERCIISEDEIADDASANLKNIRRQMKITNDRVHSQLSSLINSQSGHTYLQDALITMRDGRYCVPVKQEYRGNVNGIIHDQSSTGSTLFIEPAAVVELNNKLRELEAKEADEIQIILANLSMACAEHIYELKTDMKILPKLDFIFAKASLAKEMKASMPEFNDQRQINIKKGRHPLLDPKKVVPIDIHLGKDFNLLIVTGPNTGGKTVSLKTIGLFTLMGQAGLHIPAFDGSSLRIFNEVYADIGDEQSIEQSLSTFSSHMVNTVSILEKADENSLVLFDELGAGTDPVEGAALATAILSNLHNRHSTVMATTHYSELKLYALQTPDVENACCEFDVTTLRPTYKLLIGVPGKSNAFAISSKLGLTDDIIEDAQNHVASDAKHFEDVLAELEKTRVELEKEHEMVSKSRKEISELKKSLKEKNEKIDNSKDRILQHANEEASRILAEAKDYADETIRKYTKWASSDKHIKEMEAQRAALREKMDSKQSKIKVKNNKPKSKQLKPSDLFIGADIKVLSLGANGTVSTLPNEKGDLFVQAGLLRTKVNIKDIELLPQKKTENTGNHSGGGKIRMNKASGIKGEINLIGMTVDQAMPVLEKYLDDAYLAHMSQVTVIHGRGTGALRTATHNHLKRTKYVKSFRLGEFGEGDMGVTIVNFK